MKLHMTLKALLVTVMLTCCVLARIRYVRERTEHLQASLDRLEELGATIELTDVASSWHAFLTGTPDAGIVGFAASEKAATVELFAGSFDVTHVNWMNLSGDGLDASLVDALAGCKQLSRLTLDDVNLDEVGLGRITGNAKETLTRLRVTVSTAMSARWCRRMSEMAALEELQLSGFTVAGDEFAAIISVPRLSTLDLSQSHVGPLDAANDALKALSCGGRIRRLYLWSGVRAADLQVLAGTESLETLDLVESDVRLRDLSWIQSCPNLATIAVSSLSTSVEDIEAFERIVMHKREIQWSLHICRPRAVAPEYGAVQIGEPELLPVDVPINATSIRFYLRPEQLASCKEALSRIAQKTQVELSAVIPDQADRDERVVGGYYARNSRVGGIL